MSTTKRASKKTQPTDLELDMLAMSMGPSTKQAVRIIENIQKMEMIENKYNPRVILKAITNDTLVPQEIFEKAKILIDATHDVSFTSSNSYGLLYYNSKNNKLASMFTVDGTLLLNIGETSFGPSITLMNLKNMSPYLSYAISKILDDYDCIAKKDNIDCGNNKKYKEFISTVIEPNYIISRDLGTVAYPRLKLGNLAILIVYYTTDNIKESFRITSDEMSKLFDKKQSKDDKDDKRSEISKNSLVTIKEIFQWFNQNCERSYARICLDKSSFIIQQGQNAKSFDRECEAKLNTFSAEAKTQFFKESSFLTTNTTVSADFVYKFSPPDVKTNEFIFDDSTLDDFQGITTETDNPSLEEVNQKLEVLVSHGLFYIKLKPQKIIPTIANTLKGFNTLASNNTSTLETSILSDSEEEQDDKKIPSSSQIVENTFEEESDIELDDDSNDDEALESDVSSS